MIQTEMATVRCWPSWNMLRMSDRVEGARVAPATPRSARAAMRVPALLEKAATTEAAPNAAAPRREGGEDQSAAERRPPDKEKLPPADPVAEGSHRDERARHEEPVDVD